MSSPAPTQRSTYAFDNSAASASVQLSALERHLDPVTAARLAPLARPGMRCWEVGAGGGSVAGMLVDATGPDGRVIATDIDPSQVRPGERLVVLRHDVRSGPVPGGPFDLIHARLVLMHLPERLLVLRRLAASLAPGGWLLIEEFDCSVVPPVLRAPSAAARDLFVEVVGATIAELERGGMSGGWAWQVHQEMTLAGLTGVSTVASARSWVGDPAGTMLYDVNARHLRPRLEAAGTAPERLDAFLALTRDPGFAALSYPVVSTTGRRPQLSRQRRPTT